MKKYFGVVLQNMLIVATVILGTAIYLEVSDNTMSDGSKTLLGIILGIVAVISAVLITWDEK